MKWPKASVWANQRPGQTTAVPSPSGGHGAGLGRGGVRRHVQQLLCYRATLSAAVTPTNFTGLSLASPASGPDYSRELYECDNGCLTYAAPLIRLTPPVAALFAARGGRGIGGGARRDEGRSRKGGKDGGTVVKVGRQGRRRGDGGSKVDMGGEERDITSWTHRLANRHPHPHPSTHLHTHTHTEPRHDPSPHHRPASGPGSSCFLD